MKPVFAVQVTNRDDTEIALTVAALEKLGYEWINFGLIPFTTEITNLEAVPKDRMIVPLSGTKLMDLWQANLLPHNWEVWYDSRLMDQYYTKTFLAGHMLNEKSMIYKYADVFEMTFPEDQFVKPTNDFKVFAGAVIPAGDSLRDYLETVNHQAIDADEKILVAPLQLIDREFRCFVIDNAVIDISEYRSHAGIKAKKVSEETARTVTDFVQSLSAEIDLACVDVCEVLNDDGSFREYKIVEINCFHCAGMYLVDRAKVFEALVKAITEGRI
jgi:hypothetical protein